jgi:hypothetical protein
LVNLYLTFKKTILITGQAETGYAVDHTTFRPEWSMQMAHATWEKLKQ